MEKKMPYLMVRGHKDKSLTFEIGGEKSDALEMLAFATYWVSQEVNIPWIEVLRYLSEKGLPDIEAQKNRELYPIGG